MPRPHCIVCDKPIPKRTTTWYIREAQEAREETTKEIAGRMLVDQHARAAKPDGTVEDSFGGALKTIYLTQRPRDRAGCQKLTNERVIHNTRDGRGFVDKFSTWDEETYLDTHFHSNACAEAFGRAVAKRHYDQELK